MMYGIVTNAHEWMFVRWAGNSKKPKIANTPHLICPFDGDLVHAKEILNFIIRILESQIIHNINNNPYKKIKV